MSEKSIPARFYNTGGDGEPVRDWLRKLGRPDSVTIGEDIGVVQRGWPVGMPVCRAMGDGLYEIRSNLGDKRIARTLFCFHEEKIVLLHGFIKKSRKTPDYDLKLARDRKRRLSEAQRDEV